VIPSILRSRLFRQLFQRHAGISPVPTGEAFRVVVCCLCRGSIACHGDLCFHSSESCDHPDRSLKAVFIRGELPSLAGQRKRHCRDASVLKIA